ncbi:biogenesis of lysosome-related organelles complex 1 subunit 3-like [Elysia marginata]|uniref:Biogenesis of lysosome-related organelles complex 1 subunit 3 n=1 Tax=Elysia marginata TaxID=1093978 RepID=A0AAV4ELA6_9GAST|nr:biogenesis of lysosome-related organelles complex 1 subunit 3-like [Elysia marginata]
MDNKQYQTVVQGEASESDSEEEELSNESAPVVIEGEAEESDEEELNTTDLTRKKDLSALKVTEYSTSFDAIDATPGTTGLKKIGKSKHDTVLNRKLWDSNFSFCNNLSNLVSHTYLAAAKDITNCSQQVARSHTLVQDVSHSMRLMTNDLFNLHDRIDIVTSCKILPTISIASKVPSASASLQSSSSSLAQAEGVGSK